MTVRTPDAVARSSEWMQRAACRELNDDTMFPDGEAAIAYAKSICAACPVEASCLQAALDAEGDATAKNRYGVRGGQTKSQRRRAYEQGLTAAQVLARQRGRAALKAAA